MREILQIVARQMAYWFEYWERHCWQCKAERDYESFEPCKECGADYSPF